MKLTTPAPVLVGGVSVYHRRSVAEEWVPGALYTDSKNTSTLLIRKSALQRHFNEQNRLTAPVAFVVASDTFDAWGLHIVIREHPAGGGILTLTLVLAAGVPDHAFTGRRAVPEKYRPEKGPPSATTEV